MSPQAFEQIVNRYRPRLYGVSLRILRNHEDAEDALQHSFLKAFKSLESFRGESSMYGWLYRIVQNQSVTQLRQKRRRTLISIDSDVTGFEQRNPQRFQDRTQKPDLALRFRELSEFLDECLKGLSENSRDAWLMKDMEKLSERQASRILGIPRSTLKSRVHRARILIRRQVKEHFRPEFKTRCN